MKNNNIRNSHKFSKILFVDRASHKFNVVYICVTVLTATHIRT